MIARAVLVMALLGMLSGVPVVSFDSLRVDAAVLLVVIAASAAIIADWRTGLPLFGCMVILYLFGAALPFWADVAAFVIAGALLWREQLLLRSGAGTR